MLVMEKEMILKDFEMDFAPGAESILFRFQIPNG